MSDRLIPAERRRMILDLLQKEGNVRVLDLSEQLRVSEVTIRRDLELMEGERLLERTHGGAVLSRRMRIEPAYQLKYHSFLNEKKAIGAAAGALIEPGETVFIHSGSTTLQIFPHLINKKVKVITSNAGAITEAQSAGLDLVCIGGTYREQSNSFVGPLAIQALHNFYASKCFIGVDGVSRQYGLTTPSIEEADVARAMITHTLGQVIIVADHSKLGQVADCVTAPMDRVDILIVDSGFDEDYRIDLENQGVRIIVAT